MLSGLLYDFISQLNRLLTMHFTTSQGHFYLNKKTIIDIYHNINLNLLLDLQIGTLCENANFPLFLPQAI